MGDIYWIDVAAPLIVYAAGIYVGWNCCSVWGGKKREIRRTYRLGLKRGLHFWARVVKRQLEHKEEK